MNNNKFKKQYGFSFIELMVALAIVALLMAYGLPAFNNFSIRQNLSNQTNNLLSDLSFARNLAVDKGTTVTVVSTNGSDWEGGWTIVETLADLSLQNVRVTQQLPGNVTITENNGLGQVSYSSIGSANQPMTFNVQHSNFPNYLNVSLLPSGMASSNRTL